MSSKKRVCLVITRMIAGGAQDIVLKLLQELPRDKYELTLVTGAPGNEERTLLGAVPDNVKVYKSVLLKREIAPLSDFLCLLWLCWFFLTNRFDCIHLHTSKAGVLGAISAWLTCSRNIVYTPHGHIFGENANIPGFSDQAKWKRDLLFRMRRFAYGCCSCVVALSQEDKKQQVELGLAKEEKFRVVFNGIDSSRFCTEASTDSSLLREKLKEDAEFLIGCVGRLSSEKGQDILIKAMSEVLASRLPVKLVLAGEGGFYSKLRDMVDELGVGSCVVFVGFEERVEVFMQALDVLVLPSRYESQGLVLIEAMACGTPIVASEVGGVPGLIEDGRNGLLVPGESPEQLGKAIVRILKDSELRDSVAAGSRAVFEEHPEYDLKAMVKNYEELYGLD